MDSVHPIWLIIFSAFIAFLPVLIGMFTAYLKISIVLGMTRSALGTQHVPSNLVVMVLSIALTSLVMMPVLEESLRAAEDLGPPNLAAVPAVASLSSFGAIYAPWKKFMFAHCGDHELSVITDLARKRTVSAAENVVEAAPILPEAEGDHPFSVLAPAFVLSELKEGFVMGFILLLPFLAIDLIVANLLVGLGMYMVSPVMIALPIKLLIFVFADGWMLVSEGLVGSYGT